MKVNNILEDINIDKPRDRFMVSSKYNSRKPSTYSDISFISYMNRIKAQSINPL